MFSKLLGQDPEAQRKTKECREQIRVLKEAVREIVQNRNLQVLPTYGKQHPLPDEAASAGDVEFKSRKKLSGHFGKIYSLHWSSDSGSLVSASQDGKLLVWNAETENKEVAIALRSAWVMTCAFSPNRNFVASGGLDNLCSLFRIGEDFGWEINDPTVELQQHEGYLSCCRFIDNNKILTASGDGTIILWDINKSQKAERVFNDHNGDVQSVSVHPNNPSMFASGAIDAQAKIWDIRLVGGNNNNQNNQNNNNNNNQSNKPMSNSACVATFTGHDSDINDVTWFRDGLSIASGSDDATCRLWDIAAHRQLSIYQSGDIYSTVTEIDFSQSGRFLFAGYDEEPFCLVWDTIKCETYQTLQHINRASCLQVAPSGMALATGCWDRLLRIWA